jgi:DNA polymerase-3 subunit beta
VTTATASGILIDRSALLEALTAVMPAVPSRSPKPLLMNVLLSLDPDGSEIIGTDLEVGIRHRLIGVHADAPVKLLLPPVRLKQILSTSDDDEIAFRVDGDKVQISGRRSQFNLPLEDPDLFPLPPEFGASAFHAVSPADLRRLIRCTIYATDDTSQRYALGGCLLEVTADTMIAFVATDGRRLSRQVVGCVTEGEVAIAGMPVLPKKCLMLVDKVLDEDEESVRISVTDNAVLFRTESATIYSRLVEGRFPKYSDVLPSSSETVVTVEAGVLLDGCLSAAIMTSEESRGCDLAFSGDNLRLSSQSADVGAGMIDLDVTPVSGESLTLTLDPRYVIEVLKPLDRGDVVRIEMTDAKSPVAFKVEPGHTSIVMPLTRDR